MTEISQLLEDDRLAELRERLALAVSRVGPDWVDPDALVDVVVAGVLEAGGGALPGTKELYRQAHGLLLDEIRLLRAARPGQPPTAEERLGLEIRAGLDELEPSRARALTLYLLGHTVPEAGALLGLDTRRAETLVYRGLADLRGWLRAKELAK